MKKIYMILLSMSFLNAHAVNNASSPIVKVTSSVPASNNCGQLQQQVLDSRQKIVQAFSKNDACMLGNTTIQTHNLIQANLQCFPKFAKGQYNIFKVFDKIDTSIDKYPANCDNPRSQVTGNDQQIKQALLKEDGCTAGKIELQSYKIIQANLSCFPLADANPNNLLKALDTINANASAAK